MHVLLSSLASLIIYNLCDPSGGRVTGIRIMPPKQTYSWELKGRASSDCLSERVSEKCLALIVNARKKISGGHFWRKTKNKVDITHLSYDYDKPLCDDFANDENITAVTVGRSWPRQNVARVIGSFFHFHFSTFEWRAEEGIHRWKASALGIYWPAALTDGRKHGYYADRCQSCTRSTTFRKCEEEEEEEGC